MEKKVFGYPEFSAEGEQILCTYENEYRDMLMDIRVYRMKKGEERRFSKEKEEFAVLLLSGKIKFVYEGTEKKEAVRMSLPKDPMQYIFPREKRF